MVIGVLQVKVKIIKQLTDNYCYIIYSTETNEALILDPAEPNPILDNGPINKTSNPPPTSIRIHIQKINEKIDTFMTIQFP